MHKLTLVGLSDDGQQVVFVDDAGTEFGTSVDDRLRAALRGDRPRLGQLEIDMQSALRPRDIQARIRAGESPEAVAALAQVSVDKIMAYCVPVLAERQYIAQLAQRSHVRRRNADGPAARLADVVVDRLRSRGVDPKTADWESWRRTDGRWVVEVSYRSGERARTAHFVFDAAGRYSLADDDEAKWLTGERQSTSKGPQPRETGKPGERRLAAVPSGDDLLRLSESGAEVESPPDDEGTDDLTAVVRAVREPDPRSPSPSIPPASSTAGDEGSSASTQHTLRPSPSERDALERSLVGAVGERDSSLHEVSSPDIATTSAPARTASAPAAIEDREVDKPAAVEAAQVDPAEIEAAEIKAAEVEKAKVEPGKIEPAGTVRRRRSSKRASVPTWDEIMFGKSKQE